MYTLYTKAVNIVHTHNRAISNNINNFTLSLLAMTQCHSNCICSNHRLHPHWAFSYDKENFLFILLFFLSSSFFTYCLCLVRLSFDLQLFSYLCCFCCFLLWWWIVDDGTIFWPNDEDHGKHTIQIYLCKWTNHDHRALFI